MQPPHWTTVCAWLNTVVLSAREASEELRVDHKEETQDGRSDALQGIE